MDDQRSFTDATGLEGVTASLKEDCGAEEQATFKARTAIVARTGIPIFNLIRQYLINQLFYLLQEVAV
jgi:hypothetical protein